MRKRADQNVEQTDEIVQGNARGNATPRVITRNTKKPRVYDDLLKLKKLLQERRFR